MKPLKAFTIPFVGLKLDKHQFKYKIDNAFLAHFEHQEFNEVIVEVILEFTKKSTFFELDFNASGIVNVNCDVTNEPFDLSISNTLSLVVKFGSEFNDENEDILIIPHGEYELNVQQYVYELLVLGVPSKRVHPGVEDGTLDSEILDKLEELSPGENSRPNDTKESDPRWNKLKNLLNDKQ